MRLSLLEIIALIQRIQPRFEEEFGPVAIPHDKAPRRQPVLVLRQHEPHVLPLQVAECLDDAVGRDNREVLLHELVEFCGVQDMLGDFDVRVHDECVLVEEPDVAGVGELREGVADRDDGGPGGGGVLEVVVGGVDEEGFVAWSSSCQIRYVCLSLWCRNIPCLSAYSLRFSFTISKYPLLYFPSSSTVTNTTGGFPDGMRSGLPPCPLLLLDPLVRRYMSVKKASPARAISLRRVRRRVGSIGRRDWRGR